MSYGRLSDAQRAALRDAVVGEVVHDLGAGACTFSDILVELGATKVYAVDKSIWAPPTSPKVEVVETYFMAYTGPAPEVAFLSWPDNHPLVGLLQLLSKCRKVIYLGKNTEGTSCGWPGLFEELATREILVHLPAPKNTLTVYSDRRVGRPLTGEEFCGINVHGEFLSFESASRLDKIGGR